MRIAKFLSQAGIASRRKAELLIHEGRVFVNDVRIGTPATIIDPEKDIVHVGKQVIKKQPTFVYYVLNKPKGVVSTVHDEKGRQTVTKLVQAKQRIYPIGRLDKDTTGLLLLTNDGTLTNLLTHPRYHIPKTYHLWVQKGVTTQQIKRLQEGVELEDGKTAPATVVVQKVLPQKTLLEMTIHQGKKRQIRRMCEVLGINLLELQRIAIGSIKLGSLPIGSYRSLLPHEILRLKAAAKK